MIVGSAAGALVGLQFVVMTLIAERPPSGAESASGAFATPTVVHFSVVLFLSAVIRAPWRTMTSIAALWGLVALVGLVYAAIVVRRMRTQTGYKPGFEDWSYYAVLPAATYAILGGSALMANSHPREALFGLAAGVLLLLFLGIRNAWDTVTYHVLVNRGGPKPDDR